MENCQVGVFLAYCAPDGSRALIDRELYVPEKWTQDPERCRAAGIGEDVSFATKPQLVKAMIARALKACVPFRWVTRDKAYGSSPELREWLEQEKTGYVLAVACSAMIPVGPDRAMRADGARGARPGGRVAADQLRRRVERSPPVRLGARPPAGVGSYSTLITA